MSPSLVQSAGKIVRCTPLPTDLAAIEPMTGPEVDRWQPVFEYDYQGAPNYIGRASGDNLVVPAPDTNAPMPRRFAELQSALENAAAMARANLQSFVVKQTHRGAHLVLPAAFATYGEGVPFISGSVDLDVGDRVRISERGIEAIVNDDSIAMFVATASR